MNIFDKREACTGQEPSARLACEPRFLRHGAIEAHTTGKGTLKLRLVLLPGFSQLSLSSFIDPFRCANALTDHRPFEWQTFGIGTAAVASSSGILVEVDASLDACRTDDRESALVLIGGVHVEDRPSPQLSAFLRRQARHNVPIYAIGTATWLLAEAGVLRSGARCTIHWTKLAALSETFRDVIAEDVLFVRDGNVTTCAGDFAAFDLAADMIEERCGTDLARSVCEQLTADRWRSGKSCRSVPPGLRYAGAAGKVLRVVKMMERNTEDPLPLDELSRRVSLSRRQIERLFEKHLKTTPYQYYLALRLQKARQLLETTSMPVIDVAMACGFISSSHFAKSFKEHFRIPPSRTRATATTLGPRFAA